MEVPIKVRNYSGALEKWHSQTFEQSSLFKGLREKFCTIFLGNVYTLVLQKNGQNIVAFYHKEALLVIKKYCFLNFYVKNLISQTLDPTVDDADSAGFFEMAQDWLKIRAARKDQTICADSRKWHQFFLPVQKLVYAIFRGDRYRIFRETAILSASHF